MVQLPVPGGSHLAIRPTSLTLCLLVIACGRPAASSRMPVDTAATVERPAPGVAADTTPVAHTPAPLPIESVTVAVELPPPMRQVLHDSIPGFVIWSMRHYAPEVQWWLKHIRHPSPAAIFGDFNNDSIGDVVLDGTDGVRSLMVALVSIGASYRLLVLEAGEVSDMLQNSIEFLALEPRGTTDTLACHEGDDQCRHESFTLGADAFQEVFYDKASVLHHWTGNGFAQSVTSD